MIGALLKAARRAYEYRRRFGWRQLLLRLLRVPLWWRRLTRGPLLPSQVASRSEYASQRAARPFGVNIIGHVADMSSLGEATRRAAAALESAGVPVVLIDESMPMTSDPALQAPAAQSNPYRFNLIVSMPRSAENFGHSLARDYLLGRYNVAFWPWEYPTIPGPWHSYLLDFDEVWTPSTFVQTALAQKSPIPVHCIPHPVLAPGNAPRRRSRYLDGIPPAATVFLFVFNLGLFSVPRKNADGLIAAFQKAFTPSDDAWLVIKSTFRRRKSLQRELQRLAGAHNIRIIDGWLSREELDELMASADCYVSLHRAEGFGLTMAEAMALGKPVIATAYSGNIDFTTPENSYLVGYKMATVRQMNAGVNALGRQWAEPDLNQAAEYMRHVHKFKDEAMAVGERGRADVQRLLSVSAIGLRMKERLHAISARSDPAGSTTTLLDA